MNVARYYDDAYCDGCKHLDKVSARCNKHNTPLPVNYKLDYIKCTTCKEDNKDESTYKT